MKKKSSSVGVTNVREALASFSTPAWRGRLSGRGTSSHEERPDRRGLAIALSVLISCVLWFTFSMQETYVRTFQFPTVVQNLPRGAALAELPPPRVQVEVQGPGWQLVGLTGLLGAEDNLPVVPINAAEDQVNLDAVVRGIPLNKNVFIRTVAPQQLDLRKEPRVVVKVPVRVLAEIKPPLTHDLAAPPVVTPDSIVVAGARSVVDQLEYWPTEPIEILNLRDSVEVTLPLADTLRGLVTRSVERVTLRVAATAFTEGTREIDVAVRGVPSSEELVRLEPQTVTVRYRVPLSQFDAVLEAPDFYAELSYDEVLADTSGLLRPRLNLPPQYDIRDVELIPPTVRAYQVIQP